MDTSRRAMCFRSSFLRPLTFHDKDKQKQCQLRTKTNFIHYSMARECRRAPENVPVSWMRQIGPHDVVDGRLVSSD
ncbi:hypothetical protein REMIM1_PE00293 (plasmid) [Rhizobium etli bv. mimosae str. Mim1]|nr:hypothetical protein REMIM1_PE00293 [Rhizobium etli bv. mimosae str. Mim1]